MKNIHVLPTDKPSRLYKTGNFLLLDSKAMPNNTLGTINQHIYITSDEALPYDSSIFDSGAFYHIDPVRDVHIITKHTFKPNPHFCKRIILTTDQDLIKDGVQAIDDEFLEWFVKNPSREYVNFISYGNEKGTKDYELIIPKKVPNQTDEKGRPMTYWGGLAEPSQEPLEEADYEKLKQSLIEFRKVPITFVPDERMYSEEEVLEILCKSHNAENTSIKANMLNKWFEQFKKK